MLTAGAFLTAYIQPCKSPSTNISLSFHLLWLAVGGVIVSNYIYDNGEIDSPIKTLLVCITPIPHILMLLWVVYTALCKIGQTKVMRVFLTNRSMGRQLFAKCMSQVNMLPDRLENSQDYCQLTGSRSNDTK